MCSVRVQRSCAASVLRHIFSGSRTQCGTAGVLKAPPRSQYEFEKTQSLFADHGDTVRPLAHNDTFSGLCVESACRVWSHRLRVESQAVESQTRTARA